MGGWDELLKSVSWQKVAVVVIAAAVTITAGMWLLRGAGPLEGNHATFTLDHHGDGCLVFLEFNVGSAHTGNVEIAFISDRMNDTCLAFRELESSDYTGRKTITDSIKHITGEK